jgi:hypothetical protein
VDVRLGLEYADGRRLRTTDLRSPMPGDTGGIWPQGGGGGDQLWQQELWVWPLPPPGEVAFVVEWPETDIPETWTRLDAGPIVAAAARATAVWPEDLPPGEPAGRNRHLAGAHGTTSSFAAAVEPEAGADDG